MYKIVYIALFINLFVSFSLSAQDSDADQKVLNFRIIEPGAFVYEDLGTDEEGQIDLYKDGAAQFSLQLLGINILTKGKNFRAGFSIGVGLSKASAQESNTDALIGIASAGLIFQLLEGTINVETGYMYGHSFKEEENKSLRNDSALYFGISLPTKLGDLF